MMCVGKTMRLNRQRWARSVSRGCGAWLVLGLLIGCSSSDATVSGTVTLDGKPVEGSPQLYGTVSFYPQGGGGAPAVAIIDSYGRYELKTGSTHGLAPGNYAVTVAVKKIHPPAEPGGLTRPERLSATKFSEPTDSGLTADVKPGSNRFDFAITSGE